MRAEPAPLFSLRAGLRPVVVVEPRAAARLVGGQVDRHGLIGFLVRYVTEYLRHLWRYRSMDRAYREISFEIEARAAESL